ncbi:MAG: HAMP domain-containing protein [Trichocoleus desertorum ATA4-8-CV12]|jgi:signal transduction histidine kinase|nr:HAMP domain-containing protein [Trichocoleus desertorum ATA4-8-CV12]
MKNPATLITRRLRKVPLQTLLVAPFVLQIAIAVGLTGWLSLRNGQNAVNDVASQLRTEVTARIQQHVTTYLETPHLVNQINADVIRLGLLNVEDIPGLERYFWQQMQQFKTVSYISLGTEQAEYIGVERLDNAALQIEVSDRVTGRNFQTYATDSQGNRTRLLQSKPNYDPRRRDWYKTSVKAGKPVWTEIYTYFSTQKLTITADLPLYDAQGKLIGVTAADLVLSQIGDYLRSLKIGKTGQTFIMERSGLLVATSLTDKPFSLSADGKTQERLAATASRNKLIRATAQHLQQRFGDLRQIRSNQQLDFRLEGNRQFLQVLPLQDGRGLDWLIVVVVPEADFMEQIEANTRSTILLCLAALIAAIALGILTSRWIVQPILHLSRAAKALSQGEWEQTVPVEREDELGVLARAFQNMAEQLRASFAVLEQRNEELEVRVQERTADIRAANEQLLVEIAERKRVEDALRVFLHAVSHDLRNPVTGMLMVLGNLLKSGSLPTDRTDHTDHTNGSGPAVIPVARAILERMAQSSDRQLYLINSLLEVHASEVGGIVLQTETVDLGKLVVDVLADFEPLLAKNQASFTTRIPNDLPAISADPLQVRRVVENLLANALKHNPPGLSLSLSVEWQDDLLLCRVQDNGSGIKPEVREHLFELYSRGPQTRRSMGLGLGLYLCRQIVVAHGGEMGVTSEPGSGSTFWFTLPLAPVAVSTKSP